MWHDFKIALMDLMQLNPAQMHIVVGVVVFLALGITLRNGALAFWLLVVIEATNECIDIWDDAHAGRAIRYWDPVSDGLFTITMPLIILIILFGWRTGFEFRAKA